MILPGFVLAYHGCDKAVAERILAGKDQVKLSRNDDDWLGPGVYFWENAAQRALEWAAFLKARPSLAGGTVKEPFALVAIINPGWCLDLTEASDLKPLRESYDRLSDFSPPITRTKKGKQNPTTTIPRDQSSKARAWMREG